MTRPTVVLLHGLARTARSLHGLRQAIDRAGYDTWARTYASRKRSIAECAQETAEHIARDLPGRPLVAVTHSLGGILVRHMATTLPWQGAVMLAPPNAGSRIAGMLHQNPIFRWFYGPAGRDVVDPSTWPMPPTPFAVIAGTRAASLGNPTSWLTRALRLFPPDDPSDGTIAVRETRLPGMADFATVDADHTWLMNDPRVHAMVLAFLATGRLTND